MAVPSRKNVARAQRKGEAKKFNKKNMIVVDMKDHVVGRAAAVLAKQLLLGKRIVAVRVDEANLAGSEIRNKIKYLNFLRKKKQTNPKKGPFHKRAPSDVFCRVVRGMLPFYTKRGKSALRRLVAYEGVPKNVARLGQRVVIPKAQRQARLMPERSFTVLGNMCQHIGWKYKGVVDQLEVERKEKAAREHEKRVVVKAAWDAARKEAVAKMPAGAVATLQKFGAL